MNSKRALKIHLTNFNYAKKSLSAIFLCILFTVDQKTTNYAKINVFGKKKIEKLSPKRVFYKKKVYILQSKKFAIKNILWCAQPLKTVKKLFKILLLPKNCPSSLQNPEFQDNLQILSVFFVWICILGFKFLMKRQISLKYSM